MILWGSFHCCFLGIKATHCEFGFAGGAVTEIVMTVGVACLSCLPRVIKSHSQKFYSLLTVISHFGVFHVLRYYSTVSKRKSLLYWQTMCTAYASSALLLLLLLSGTTWYTACNKERAQAWLQPRTGPTSITRLFGSVYQSWLRNEKD